MRQIAKETWEAYEKRLERAEVPAKVRPDYHKWTRFYLDFCDKYGHAPRARVSLGPFLAKLAAKKQSEEQRQQAAQAINLLVGPNPKRNEQGIRANGGGTRNNITRVATIVAARTDRNFPHSETSPAPAIH